MNTNTSTNTSTRTPQAGFTLMELVCAFAMLAILISMAVLGTAGKFGQVRRDYLETLALRALSGRLEELQMDRQPLEVGVSTFPLPPTARKLLHAAVTTQTIQQVELGLFEVEAMVTWRPTARHAPLAATLKTLVVREHRQDNEPK